MLQRSTVILIIGNAAGDACNIAGVRKKVTNADQVMGYAIRRALRSFMLSPVARCATWRHTAAGTGTRR